MAIKRREVRSIVILSLKGRFYGDAETDELEKAILADAAAGNKMLVLNMAECEALSSACSCGATRTTRRAAARSSCARWASGSRTCSP